MRTRMTVLVLAMIAVLGAALLRAHAQEAGKQKPADEQVEEMMRKLEAQKKERKAALDKALKEAGDRLKPLLQYSIDDLQLALSIKVRETYDGARVFSDEDEPTFLGTVTDEFGANSIFNEFGSYGSEFASKSIWNDFGKYGGQFSTHSPFNAFSSRPPILLKGEKVIGRLTVNRSVLGAVEPNWLKSFYAY